MEEISVKHIKSLWRGNEIGWNFLLAKGTAGGILIMWRVDRVWFQNIIKGEITLACLFSNIVNGDS